MEEEGGGWVLGSSKLIRRTSFCKLWRRYSEERLEGFWVYKDSLPKVDWLDKGSGPETESCLEAVGGSSA